MYATGVQNKKLGLVAQGLQAHNLLSIISLLRRPIKRTKRMLASDDTNANASPVWCTRFF
nr:MAG TPA: hypothetical protein [Caudoviricetes sp.]